MKAAKNVGQKRYIGLLILLKPTEVCLYGPGILLRLSALIILNFNFLYAVFGKIMQSGDISKNKAIQIFKNLVLFQSSNKNDFNNHQNHTFQNSRN